MNYPNKKTLDKKNTDFPPERECDYKIFITLIKGKLRFEVSCKIFLPKENNENPQIFIYPNRSDYNNITASRSGYRLKDYKKDDRGFEFIFENVELGSSSMKPYEKGLEEIYIKIHTTRLIIKHYNRNYSGNLVVFKITPSLHLTPNSSREMLCPDGEIKVKNVDNFQFELENDFKILAKNNYIYEEFEMDKLITFPELQVESMHTQPIDENNIETYLSLFDDFLLLISFAEGQRCMTPKIIIYSEKNYIEIYRCNRTFPSIHSYHCFNSFNISSENLMNFLNKAWKIWRESNHKELIKLAISTITEQAGNTMESRFLTLFSSIESLLLVFRKENNLEHILPLNDNQWEQLSKEIKELTKKNQYLKENKDKYSLMWQNINGINGIPLKYVFEKFIDQKKLHISDLWPFANEGNNMSLTKIRNKLVHGYGVNERYTESFLVAKRSLEIYLVRLLLATFEWDIMKSKVHHHSTEYSIEKRKYAQDDLKSWL